MKYTDLELLVKKVFIGIAITAIPALLLIGGLWLTERVVGTHHVQTNANESKGQH